MAPWAALRPAAPVLLTYLMSFAYLGIYWNNHHHMLQATTRVNGLILWANLHLLFWLSLIPFTTGWLGENHLAATPAAGYGIVLLAAALAYYGLQTVIIRDQGSRSVVAAAVGRDVKGKRSPLLYIADLPGVVSFDVCLPWRAERTDLDSVVPSFRVAMGSGLAAGEHRGLLVDVAAGVDDDRARRDLRPAS
jgi:uncharacterized membrane protein